MTYAYVYVTNVINVSQLWALYCLAGFYLQLHKDMVRDERSQRIIERYKTVRGYRSSYLLRRSFSRKHT